jgi:hypothetical protein
MDMMFVFLGLVVLGVLALRYGYDSRERFQSKEQELACFGMQWPEFQGRPLARPVRRLGIQGRVRRAVARKLLALADWLAPAPPARHGSGNSL